MKRLLPLSILLFLLFALPAGALAFADVPVAVVVLDKSGGDLDARWPAVWREQVRQSFSFPDYKLIDQADLSRALPGQLPQTAKKSPYYQKSQLRRIADLAQAELVIAIVVGRMQERIDRPPFSLGETTLRVDVAIDVIAYKKTGDQYLMKKIRHSDTSPPGVSPTMERLATYEVQDAIRYFREQWSKAT